MSDNDYRYDKRGKYWLLPIDDRMYKSLQDIGIDRSFNIYKLKDYLNIICPDGLIYISMRNGDINYNYTNGIYDSNDFFDSIGYEYMGKVNIDDVELDAKKYNI